MQNNHKGSSTQVGVRSGANSWMPDQTYLACSADDIAEMLDSLAEIAQITGNTFREKAFTRAAKIFRGKNVPRVIELATVDNLQKIPGIGPGITMRIAELISTGRVEEIETAKKSPRYRAFAELTSILGVGPKTAATWIDLGIYSMGDLRRAIGTGKIVPTKQQELGIRWYSDLLTKIPRKSVELIARRITSLIMRAFHTTADRVIVAGSYRRGAAASGDIDMLVRGSHRMQELTKIVAEQPEFIDFISAGDERMSFLWIDDGTARQIDILLRPDSAWGASLAYFTGDAQFAQSMRSRAKRMGYRLNQNGLFKKTPKTLVRVPTPTEESVFKHLGMTYLEPAARTGAIA